MYGYVASKTPKDKVQQDIKANLKRVCDEVLNEPVPERFKALLAELRDQDKAKKPDV
jgi:hypothetical protein